MSHKVRRVTIAGLAVTLLAGTGAFAASRGLLGGPEHLAQPHAVTDVAVCGWRGGAHVSPPGARLSSRTGDLVEPVLTATPYRVTLTAEETLDVPAGSAPVLVATTGVEAKVVGYARPAWSPESRTLQPGEEVEYSAFEPFVACPGEPTTADGVHLPEGSYELHAAQALGWESVKDGGPFNIWQRLGRVSLTDHEDLGDTATEVAPPAGTCGSSLDSLPSETDHQARFDPLEPVLAVQGETVPAGVRVTNHGPHALQDALQGGPALLVAQDGALVARSESADPLPEPGLGAGQSLAFPRFAPLVDCRTGAPLEPGVYEYVVVQQARSDSALQPHGAVARGGVLAVTDTPGATRTHVEPPVLPACGEPLDEVNLDSAALSGTVTFTGRAARDAVTGLLLPGAPDGRATLQVETTYPGPDRKVRPAGHRVLLVRDGVVVARSEATVTSGSSERWTSGEVRSLVVQGWKDCTDTDVVPAGTYTAVGLVDHVYDDEWGLPTHLTVAIPATEVTFEP